jgi:hypothetical protein
MTVLPLLLSLTTPSLADHAGPPTRPSPTDAAACVAWADAWTQDLAQPEPTLDPASLVRLRNQAQSALTELHEAGALDVDCVDAVRRLDRAQRRAMDTHALQGHPAATRPFDPRQLRSGDVLVTRGSALASAGIADIAAHPSDMSHNAMIYVDPAGQAWTVEAYLERGAVVQPLEDFLVPGELARIAVVRFHDEALAAEAAEAAWRRIAKGPPIGYDSGFAEGGEQLYCSEVAGWALARVGGPDDVPLHRSPFDHDARGTLYEALGIEVEAFSAPADLLVDPRVRVVSEWREVSLLPTLAQHEAVVRALYRWASEGQGVSPRWSERATVEVGLALRRAPAVGQLLAHRVHPDGDRGFLVHSLALQTAGLRVMRQLPAEGGTRRLSDEVLDAQVEAVGRMDRRVQRLVGRR